MPKQPDEFQQKIELLSAQNQELLARLEETQETLRAITTGEVDALVVYSENEERVYTLKGADYAYRVMVESIREGAANLSADGTILYCNKRLAEMLNMPLEKVLGSRMQNYFLSEETSTFDDLTSTRSGRFGRAEFNLVSHEQGTLPVLISTSPAEVDGAIGVCLVVTDLTEQKQAMARERELQIRLAEQREEERVRIARNLHDGPIQDLIGLSFNLEDMVSTGKGKPLEHELISVRREISKLVKDLRNVCNELRPAEAIQQGLKQAFEAHREEFEKKYPHISLNQKFRPDEQSISQEISTALYRIYLECINNVIRHSNASHVNTRLLQTQDALVMEVEDDGQGFELPEDWIEIARSGHLGLVGMQERAEAIGGKLSIRTGINQGTTIQVKVPREKPS